MKARLYLIVCMLLVSLVGDAKIVVPDSLLDVKKSYLFFITSPDTAQAIINTLRERKAAPEWRLDLAEGDMHYNARRYLKALTYYNKVDGREEISDSTHIQLIILKRMMDCYDELLDSDHLIRTLMRLRNLAESNHNKAFEAMTYFTSGKWHHTNGQKKLGYTYCQDAMEMMKSSDYPSKHVELRNFYGEMVKMYARDGRYDDALHMSRLQEAETMHPSPIIIKKANERGLRQTFAIRASMLAKAGRMAEATQAYESWKNTTGGNDNDNKEIYDYLRLSNKDEEALDIVTRYRDFLYRRGDTLSVRMLSVLNREALLRVEMGDYEHVPNLGSLIGTIADSINIRRSSEQMQTTYHLLKEKNESQQRAQWITILTIVLAAVLIISLVILYYVRYIRHRNVELIKVLNGLDAYRRAVINGDSPTSPEVVAALEEMRKLKLPNDLSSEELGEPDDEDRRLYVEMDKQVTRDRLFLKPGLGREDLMRLIGVDKNRFGKMMSKYSDASNSSVYINMKRVEYGAKLLLEHPEYTIAAIASECGMSNTVTFNRTFKEVYNMTPSEYREKMNALLQQKS
jgi:AraC-like DNA-binding protein/tetratricopeptide (TPR) repeat protein